jgi:hypothetical protein
VAGSIFWARFWSPFYFVNSTPAGIFGMGSLFMVLVSYNFITNAARIGNSTTKGISLERSLLLLPLCLFGADKGEKNAAHASPTHTSKTINGKMIPFQSELLV